MILSKNVSEKPYSLVSNSLMYFKFTYSGSSCILGHRADEQIMELNVRFNYYHFVNSKKKRKKKSIKTLQITDSCALFELYTSKAI